MSSKKIRTFRIEDEIWFQFLKKHKNASKVIRELICRDLNSKEGKSSEF